MSQQFFEDKAMMSKLFTDLRSKHYPVRNFFVESDSLWEELAAAGVVELHSRSTRRLWLPSPVLDGVIEEIERLRMADGLPPHGHAIDLACGAGMRLHLNLAFDSQQQRKSPTYSPTHFQVEMECFLVFEAGVQIITIGQKHKFGELKCSPRNLVHIC